MAEPSIELIARGVLRSNSNVLVCRNVKHGYCFLPGGHVEFGESSADALAREFLEETGLTVVVGRLLAIAELRFVQSSRERHEISLVFHVELSSDVAGDAATPPVQSLEPKIVFDWVPLNALSTADFRPELIVPWLQARRADSEISWLSQDERP